MVKCPCGRSSSEAKEPKTVNIFQGYFFMVNFCLGTGFLGVPFSFFYGGYIAAIPTLATAAFVTWLTSTWLLEVMARAQVSVLDTESIKNLRGV
jgi:amino acid permease